MYFFFKNYIKSWIKWYWLNLSLLSLSKRYCNYSRSPENVASSPNILCFFAQYWFKICIHLIKHIFSVNLWQSRKSTGKTLVFCIWIVFEYNLNILGQLKLILNNLYCGKMLFVWFFCYASAQREFIWLQSCLSVIFQNG